jgi:hypothetical protein
VSTITVEVPESWEAAGKLARRVVLTFNQLVASALAEKVSALAGPEWLATHAAGGDRARLKEALGKVADVESEGQDRL